jgi:hypothetical protein
MSFVLLVTAYVPWLFRLRGPRRSHHTTLQMGRLFVRLMTVAAAVALAQQVAQRAGGWRFQDYLADLVPEQFLLGDYNTVIPIQYGSPIVKSQAFVFLEPSFLSQYLALGIVVAVLIRAPLWQPLLMGVGMVTTFSGTGIVLLIAGGVLILLRSPRSLRPTLVAGVVLTGGLLLSTSLVAPLADRTQEKSDSTSSWSLRFVVPYREVAHGLAEAPERYLVGAGPGTSERLLENDKQGAGLAVVYPVAPKLAFEYGLPAGLLFLVFWLVALLRRASMPVLPGALVVMLGALSGSLLQPHTLVLAWLLSLVLAHE